MQNLTGLSCGNFGDYCATLVKCGVKKDCPKRLLTLEQMALLERTKVRLWYPQALLFYSKNFEQIDMPLSIKIQFNVSQELRI